MDWKPSPLSEDCSSFAYLPCLLFVSDYFKSPLLSLPHNMPLMNSMRNWIIELTMDEALFLIMNRLTFIWKLGILGKCKRSNSADNNRSRRGNILFYTVILLLFFYFVIKSIYYIKHNRKNEQIYKLMCLDKKKHKSFAFVSINFLICWWSCTLDIKSI